MADNTHGTATTSTSPSPEKRHRPVFELPPEFFDSCVLLQSPHSSLSTTAAGAAAALVLPSQTEASLASDLETPEDSREGGKGRADGVALARWTCNTCKAEFESLLDQRSHFKSDFHRLNVKLSVAGKDVMEEEDFDKLTSDSLKDYEISSISGSEDELDQGSRLHSEFNKGSDEIIKQKVFLQLQTGEIVSIWKSLLQSESEVILYDNGKAVAVYDGGSLTTLNINVIIQRLNDLISEPRDNTHLRIVLLASGGHFAGCVFDGNHVVAHKTFHRYVVRARAGKKQSLKDASGRAAHSAGASLRRYNELALKKDIQELLLSWKPYFDACTSIFIYAPSNNRQLLFGGEKPYFGHSQSVIRNICFTVRRPTFKEAKRIYNQLTQVAYENGEKEVTLMEADKSLSSNSAVVHDELVAIKDELGKNLAHMEMIETCSVPIKPDTLISSDSDSNEVIGRLTPLHEVTKLGNAQKVLELLEEGMDPCAKDERGRTPYMLASEKEVRNVYRRFMASNLDKWDWHAAKVPSALTKEMEESQAAKQAEKDAKRKARAKELKKLRKAKEKKDQAQAAASQNDVKAPGDTSARKGQSQPGGTSQISKEEQLKAAQAAEREKRAAAAERRMAAAAALSAQGNTGNSAPSASQPKSTPSGDTNCSCCYVSLDGKIPFHRYNYKYCSTTCMHLHREILEDG
ncbi:ANK_REP_REGION domain-containing protein [Psidium guajava]|nr:ANK_REP_REGION domain-containing protein [Psidium guajava]